MAFSDVVVQLQAFTNLSDKKIRSAAARSLNRAATSARAEGARRVQDVLNLKITDIKDAITINAASASEDLLQMRATLLIKSKPTPLYAFGAREKTVPITFQNPVFVTSGDRVGVTVNVKGTRKLVQHAFIATMPNGHVGIYVRTGDGRYPIRELFSTSVGDIFRNELFVADLSKYAQGVFRTNFNSELKFQLSKVN